MHSLTSQMCSFVLFILCIITASAAPVCNGKSCNRQVTVTNFPGHWPSSYCRIKNVVFNTGDRTLRIDSDLQELDKCHKVKDVWKFETSDTAHQPLNNIVCDQVFTRGHFFTTYYYHGSNYFHLNYDTMIPIYLALHQESLKSGDPKDIALLPGIEAVRGEGIDWSSDAFDDQNSYWMQMLMMISKPHRLLPLDQRLTAINKTICFQEAYFGTPKVDFSRPEVLHSYADFVKKALGVKPIESKSKAEKTRIGLIHREGRRKILNEEELLQSMPSSVLLEAVDFSKMSVKEQIEKVQQFDVLIGMNGAGLVNALYLPKGSVAVQLVPYKAQLNVEEFANLLKARGPYLEWHNNHPELDRHINEDVFRNGADTIVDVKEFTDIIYRSLEMLHKNS